MMRGIAFSILLLSAMAVDGQHILNRRTISSGTSSCITMDAAWDFEYVMTAAFGSATATDYSGGYFGSGFHGGAGIDCDGSNEYVEISSLDYGDSCVVSFAAYKFGGGGSDDISMYGTTFFTLGYNNGVLDCRIDNGSTNETVSSSSVTWTSSGWNFITYVVDFPAKTTYFYWNGSPAGSDTWTVANPSSMTSTAKLGCDYNQNGDSFAYFDAPSLYISGKATDAQVSTLYSTPVTQTICGN